MEVRDKSMLVSIWGWGIWTKTMGKDNICFTCKYTYLSRNLKCTKNKLEKLYFLVRYMESKDPTVFTKTYEEGVERVLKVTG